MDSGVINMKGYWWKVAKNWYISKQKLGILDISRLRVLIMIRFSDNEYAGERIEVSWNCLI